MSRKRSLWSAAAGLSGTLCAGLLLGADAPPAGEPSPPAAAEAPKLAAQPSCRGDYVMPIAPWARPSYTPHYVGYYVGGGAPCFGEDRDPLEGTWGWDYEGACFRRNVWLLWSHWRYQGGIGSYATDGPRCHPLGCLGESGE